MIDSSDQVTHELPIVEQRWLYLLRDAVRTAGRGGVTKVAARLTKPEESPSSIGATYARSYVSQVIHGHLVADKVSPHFIGAVLLAFGNGRVDCPHFKTDLAPGECKSLAALTWSQVMGTGDARLECWKACQDCLNNPANQSKREGV